jgi:hypothetical protein
MELSKTLNRVDLRELEDYIKNNCELKLDISKAYCNLKKYKNKKSEISFVFEVIKDDPYWDNSIYYVALSTMDEHGMNLSPQLTHGVESLKTEIEKEYYSKHNKSGSGNDEVISLSLSSFSNEKIKIYFQDNKIKID